MQIDYHVELVGFPAGKVHECVTPNSDGTYTIFVDKNITYESQRERVAHALKHIGGDDFSRYNVQAIEAQAHK